MLDFFQSAGVKFNLLSISLQGYFDLSLDDKLGMFFYDGFLTVNGHRMHVKSWYDDNKVIYAVSTILKNKIIFICDRTSS